ncbi:MAG: 23S rRNA (pseudouridine(1915)-N(3))-methyltransferase RlmH [Halofilum sp. (in: g-proteobacteria)]|nr:23S rRNA (pseudouridine(1915)-N(3))-methyltransferase RlmH [Halofilum sp. (in: g-proteobacteria)]
MRFHVVAVGTRMPDWVTAGFDDYARRLHGGARLELHEVAAANRRGSGVDADRARAEEAQRLRKALPGRAHVIALEVGGRAIDTEGLAARLREWNREGSEVAFLVGGPDGLEPALSRAADERWSLSALTLPHALVRVVLAEQLYRALSILHNHPYHR